MNKTIYVTLGMHRSGTSLVSHLVHRLLSIELDTLLVPKKDNPKGFWEDTDVLQLNIEILDCLGIEWNSLSRFSITEDDLNKLLDKFGTEASEILSRKLDHTMSWSFKDPRTTRLIFFWKKILEQNSIHVKYLFCNRNPLAIAHSLRGRDGFSLEYGLILYCLYVETALAEVLNDDVLIIDYESLMRDSQEQLTELTDFMGISIEATNLDQLSKEIMDTGLNHHQRHRKNARLPGMAFEWSALIDRLGKGITTKDEGRSEIERLRDDRRTAQEVLLLAENFRKSTNQKGQQLEIVSAKNQKLIRDSGQLRGDLLTQRSNLNIQNKKIRELEGDLDKAAAWEQKQTNTISDLGIQEIKLTNDIQELKDDLKSQKTNQEVQLSKITELETSLDVASKWDIKQEELITELNRQQDVISDELKRIWDIAEKHRQEHLNVTSKLTWKLTEPLRRSGEFITSLPGISYGLFKRGVFSLADTFPAKWNLSTRLRHLKQRLVNSTVDSSSFALRESHFEITSNRQSSNLHLCVANADILPEIDISIVSYNNGNFASAFMESLLSQNYPTELINLVVTDNSSTDDTLSVLEKLQGQYRNSFSSFEVLSRQNLGYGCGHHAGLCQTKSRFALIINLDIEFTPQALVRLLSFAVQDSDDTASWELRQKPYEHPKFYDPVTLETAWSSHACVLFRRSAYEDVGGYEKRIFMYGEDVELSFRFRDRGYRIKYVPSAVVYHYSYKEENEFKPLQFYGSTLANSLLRFRYGSISDIMSTIPMYSAVLAFHGLRSEIGKGLFKKNFFKLSALFFLFITSRKQSSKSFAFRGWDYEMSREGPFYTQPDVEDDQQPLVSIIIRTYMNRSYWLREALSSVLNQTYPNVEIIIVEDGSNSQKDFVTEIQRRYPNQTLVYKALPKKGRCFSANRALELAKGKLIGFLDDDDLFFCDHIETCVTELLNDPNLGAVYGLAWEVETKPLGEALEDGYEEVLHLSNTLLGDEFDREILRTRNCFPIQAVLFRRELYEMHGGFNTNLDNLEDWNLWIRYSAKNDFKLINKTTSMFRTPFFIADKLKRQKILDEYLPLAVSINNEYLKKIENNEHEGIFIS